MQLVPDLTRRSVDLERMDMPDSDPGLLVASLCQLPTINRLLTPCHRLIEKYVMAELRSSPQRAWSLLDIGAGGGDLAIEMSRACRKLNIQLQVTCLDHDPRVIEYARSNCREYSNIEIIQSDVLDLGSACRSWDFVFANHFLHHLSDAQLTQVFPIVSQVCRHRFILTDLWRSYLSYYGYSFLAALFFRNSFCFHDGLLSIRKGFRRGELQQLVDVSGLTGEAVVSWHFPGHFSIVGQSPKH